MNLQGLGVLGVVGLFAWDKKHREQMELLDEISRKLDSPLPTPVVENYQPLPKGYALEFYQLRVRDFRGGPAAMQPVPDAERLGYWDEVVHRYLDNLR
jgi:hypothetical protein